ncbi:MAG: PaaI family thioesterase [Alphaproteobacteria bacterium]|nr:PaaI family thioesterase [Alphaproteobacteria bacterium]
MSDMTQSAFPYQPDRLCSEGEFTGWRSWTSDNFENHIGPFWHREEADGTVRCAFRVTRKHLNSAGTVHGGTLMSFADYCIYSIALPVIKGPGATISFACEFIDPGREGDLVTGSGEIIRAGNSLMFLRGMVTSETRTLLNFSSTVKRFKPGRQPAPSAT